jgi:hypothetical protein
MIGSSVPLLGQRYRAIALDTVGGGDSDTLPARTRSNPGPLAFLTCSMRSAFCAPSTKLSHRMRMCNPLSPRFAPMRNRAKLFEV